MYEPSIKSLDNKIKLPLTIITSLPFLELKSQRFLRVRVCACGTATSLKNSYKAMRAFGIPHILCDDYCGKWTLVFLYGMLMSQYGGPTDATSAASV